MPAPPISKPWFLLVASATIRPGRCRIVEARDAVFAFTYHQSPPVLAAPGKVTYFSPWVDAALLVGTDYLCIYLGLSPQIADITSAKGVVVPAQLYRQGNPWLSCVHLYRAEDIGLLGA